MKKLIFWLLTTLVWSCTLLASEAVNSFKVQQQEDHEIMLLNHGLASLEERLQMIESAQKSIDVEYFIFNLDHSGRLFTQALIEKAKLGVKVRMLLDYFMIKDQLSPFYAHELQKYGIEVRYFNVSSFLGNLFKGQYRNHRKVLIIDNKSALTGGRNIGDEYFDLREDFNFLDRDIKITGPIVQHISTTFDNVWNSKYSKVVKRIKEPHINDFIYRNNNNEPDEFRFKADYRRWKESVRIAISFFNEKNVSFVDNIRTKGKELLELEYRGICQKMSYHSEYPIVGKKNRSERIIKHEIAKRIKNAKESVLFDSPYFIDDEESKESLQDALARNTKVTLLTNSLNSTDAIYVYAVFDKVVKNWIEKGLEAYIFKGDLIEGYQTLNEKFAKARYGIHAKSFVFDGKDVVIGTFNFDPRSANYNTEMTISCEDNPELAKAVSDDIHQRIKASFHLDSSKSVDEYEFYNIGFFKRLKYYILKGPSNIFAYLL